MRKLILLALVSTNALAVEYGNIISVTPVTDQVLVTKSICNNNANAGYYQEGDGSSIAGTLIGGVAGGVIGNQIGGGTGKTISTAAGAVIGAIAGNNLSGGQQPQYRAPCRNVQTYEPVHGGYQVVYEYQGRQYATRTRQMPRSSVIPLDIQPIPLVQ